MSYPNTIVQILGSGIGSGYILHPYHIYEFYNHISGIETVIGFNPLNGFASLTARISGVEAGGFAYTNIIPSLSGQYNLGALGSSWSGIFANKYFESGIRPVSFLINAGSGNSLISSKSDNIYSLKSLIADSGITINQNATDILISVNSNARSIVGPGSGLNNSIITWSGTNGTTVQGSNIIIDSSGNMTPINSGIQNIGSLSNPYNNVYANNFISLSPSFIWVTSGVGYGSISNNIRRIENINQQIGTDISVVISSASGTSFVINASGIYSMSYVNNSDAAQYIGLSVNSTQLTTNIQSINFQNQIAWGLQGATNWATIASTMYFASGSIIRPHDSPAGNQMNNNTISFKIARVS